MAIIQLTRLDGRQILLNSSFIQIIEEAPDTVVTMQNDHKLIVAEKMNEIMRKIRLSARNKI